MAIAQFSDDARTEFKLNSYTNKERLLDAVNKISYKGGNTKTGRAIQHVKENIFTAEGGVRRGIPNVLVVLTDGRSQDDVNKVSKEMQMEGQNFTVFLKTLQKWIWKVSYLNPKSEINYVWTL